MDNTEKVKRYTRINAKLSEDDKDKVRECVEQLVPLLNSYKNANVGAAGMVQLLVYMAMFSEHGKEGFLKNMSEAYDFYSDQVDGRKETFTPITK